MFGFGFFNYSLFQKRERKKGECVCVCVCVCVRAHALKEVGEVGGEEQLSWTFWSAFLPWDVLCLLWQEMESMALNNSSAKTPPVTGAYWSRSFLDGRCQSTKNQCVPSFLMDSDNRVKTLLQEAAIFPSSNESKSRSYAPPLRNCQSIRTRNNTSWVLFIYQATCKPLTFISLNLQNNPMVWLLLWCPFYRWAKER